MRDSSKTVFLLFTLFVLASGVAAQSIPEKPHRVFGDITDGSKEVTDVNVSFRYDGSVVASDVTDNSGYYDLSIPYSGTYDGENVSMFVKDTDTGNDIVFSSGSTEELDESGDYIKSSSFSVSLSDEDVDESETVELTPDVSKEGSDPDYSWSIMDDPSEDASLENDEQETVTFVAPSDVAEDTEVLVGVEVTKSSGKTKSDTAVVTVEDTGINLQDGNQEGSEDGSSGGGGTSPEDMQPEPKQVEAQTENGKSQAQIQDVEANQQVQVTVPETPDQGGSNPVEQVSFSSSTGADTVSVTVEDLGVDRPEDVEEDAGTDVYSYQQIDVEGVEDENIQESSINFKVRKSFLEERDRSSEDVVMKRYNDNQWQELDTRVDEELDDAYRFEASSTGFSYYAIALRDMQDETQGESDIRTSSLSVQPQEGTPPFDVSINVTVENSGDAEGTQEVEVRLNDEVIKSETVSLDAGRERTLSYNYTIEQSGSLSFSSGNQSVTVEASEKETSMLPVMVAILIVAILGVVGYAQRESIMERVEEFRK